jgi:NADPH-dependent curcumin reductase CurA
LKIDEVALVSGAAGAVGLIVCQLLKQRGLFVIGVAGSDEKCSLLTSEFGCDLALNYKKSPITADLLRDSSPTNKIDVFFDNVGGEIFDAAIQVMNNFGRIAICGSISQYDNLDEPSLGPRFLHRLIYTRVKVSVDGIVDENLSLILPACLPACVPYRFKAFWQETRLRKLPNDIKKSLNKC